MRSKIALFVHHPECSRQCAAGMVKSLSPHYDFKYFSENNFSEETLVDVDIIAFPGGIGDASRYHDFFNRRKGNIVADFVAKGGHYLGICMGAYWAGQHYFDILEDCDAVQYITQPKTTIRRSYHTVANVTWNGSNQNMFFFDGCAIVGNSDKFQTIATYANKDPMAIIQGRIGIIGCHPESEESWYQRDYLKQYWHKEQHHKLLLQFVDQLLSKNKEQTKSRF